MELQFQESGIRHMEDVLLETRQTELTQEIRLNDSMPDIGRVLTAWGQVQLRSKEWNREEIQVSGGVTVWVLYLPEDGTEPRCVESWLPFQMKWEVSPGSEGILRVMPLLRFADGRGTSARKIMTRAGVGLAIQAMRRNEKMVYTPEEVPGNVELLRRTYPIRIPREAGELIFQMDEEVPISEMLPPVEKLLSYTLCPMVKEKKIQGDKLIFKGQGNLHLVYRCPEGRVRSADLEIPFAQFADLDAVCTGEARADIWPAVTSLEVDAAEGRTLRIKAGMVGQYVTDERMNVPVTEDAYSPFRDVRMQMTELNLPSVLDTRSETITASQNLPGMEGQVADVCFLPDFPRQRRKEDVAELEIPGLFQVLYYGADGALQSGTARWEGHLTMGADEKTRLWNMVHTMGTEASSGAEIGMTGRLRIETQSSADTAIPMIRALELGEHREREPDRPSLILCRPEGEGLWEIAKRCGSTVAAIRMANGLEEEPAPERMLLIPVS